MSQLSHPEMEQISSPVLADPATLGVRFMLAQDQLRNAAEKVNLLAGMGLSHTQGYKAAFESYEARLAEFNALKQMMPGQTPEM